MQERTQPFREVKRSLNGVERVYECEALAVNPRLAVVRWVFTEPLTAGGETFPTGGHTIGFFWRDRTYNLYHIVGPDGAVRADRFDVIDHVRIRADGVHYDDLLLDVWLRPEGALVVEDEDEVTAAIASGHLSAERQQTIARTRELLLRRAGAIVRAALAEAPPVARG